MSWCAWGLQARCRASLAVLRVSPGKNAARQRKAQAALGRAEQRGAIERLEADLLGSYQVARAAPRHATPPRVLKPRRRQSVCGGEELSPAEKASAVSAGLILSACMLRHRTCLFGPLSLAHTQMLENHA